jgi:phospholipase C
MNTPEVRRIVVGRGRSTPARLVGMIGVALAVSSCTNSSTSAPSTSSSSTATGTHIERVGGGPTGSYIVPPGIHKIKHVIIIEQENRSFDNYFGTYPGAVGIPMKNGEPTVCVPNPATHGCTKPYHDSADIDGGGPHGEANALADVNGGKMNGFPTSWATTPLPRSRTTGPTQRTSC